MWDDDNDWENDNSWNDDYPSPKEQQDYFYACHDAWVAEQDKIEAEKERQMSTAEGLALYVQNTPFDSLCKENNYYKRSCDLYNLSLEDYRGAYEACRLILSTVEKWPYSTYGEGKFLVIEGCRKIINNRVSSITEEEHRYIKIAIRQAESILNTFDKHAAWCMREINRNFFSKVNPTYSKACYVATAVYGSYDNKQVQYLRSFRDKYLLNNKTGERFVYWYYKLSPKLINRFRNVPLLNVILKLLLNTFIKIIRIIKVI